MKRAGLQEKSSLEVVGYVEYNGAASARRSFPARKWCRGRGDATLWNHLEVAVGLHICCNGSANRNVYGNRWMSASQVVAFSVF